MKFYYQVVLRDSSPVELIHHSCTCVAGAALCNHCVALLFQSPHYSQLKVQVVPPVLSCTEGEQQWHKPRTLVSPEKRPVAQPLYTCWWNSLNNVAPNLIGYKARPSGQDGCAVCQTKVWSWSNNRGYKVKAEYYRFLSIFCMNVNEYVYATYVSIMLHTGAHSTKASLEIYLISPSFRWVRI